MLKSGKKQKGSGQQWRQKQLQWPAQHRQAPSRRRGCWQRPPRWQPEWQQLGRPASPPCRLHQGSEWGVPIAPIFWASTFFSFFHSGLLSVSWPAAPALALGIGKAGFLFPWCTRMTLGLVLVGVPAASAVRFLSHLNPGLCGILSTGRLIKP